MIVQLKGNVKFPITLDIGVWLFDDRKIEFEHAFNSNRSEKQAINEEDVEKASKAWDREINPDKVKDSVNPSLTRKERNKILETSYVMSIKPFLHNAEPKETATIARLKTNEGEDVDISLEKIENGYFLFAWEGKKLEDGPLHFYYGDGSNKNAPIKHIFEIEII